jgi:flagellar basal-body rod protein FlgC
MFGSLDISTSALTAQRTRLDTIAGNMANAHATRRADGEPGPFKRRIAVFQAGNGQGGAGVHVKEIVEDPAKGRLVFQPWHPDAIKAGEKKGYVEYPNVDVSTEMVDAMLASRAYEANIAAMEVTKSMLSSSLRLLA